MKLINGGILSWNCFKGRLKLNRTQVVLMSDKPTSSPVKPPEQIEIYPQRREMYVLNKWQKRLFVWVKKYKTIDEVPHKVTVPAFKRAMDKARIKLANYFILATVIMCVCYAITGKRAAKRGESIHKMNLDWHKKIAEDEKAKLPPA